jgi:hypothetical protein
MSVAVFVRGRLDEQRQQQWWLARCPIAPAAFRDVKPSMVPHDQLLGCPRARIQGMGKPRQPAIAISDE